MSNLWEEIPLDPVTQRPVLETAPRRRHNLLIDSHPDGNPCVKVFGAGPDGSKCTTCTHLFRLLGNAKPYYKCDLRPLTGGPGSDHRKRWPACARYAEVPA